MEILKISVPSFMLLFLKLFIFPLEKVEGSTQGLFTYTGKLVLGGSCLSHGCLVFYCRSTIHIFLAETQMSFTQIFLKQCNYQDLFL